MLNSRDINLLRSDVAANCKIFLDRCKAAGLNVLITGTVRDQEQQDVYYLKGTGGKTVTFHKIGVGLAFDICKNVKGHEYDDTSFFLKAAEIGEAMGFTWGGRWKSVDMPHFQWDNHGKTTNADIIAGRMPPMMPLYSSSVKPPVTPAIPIVSVQMQELKKGSEGMQVKVLQYMLSLMGYAVGTIDGDFGPKTDAAVRAYQKSKGLSADGIVGAKTWGALFK